MKPQQIPPSDICGCASHVNYTSGENSLFVDGILPGIFITHVSNFLPQVLLRSWARRSLLSLCAITVWEFGEPISLKYAMFLSCLDLKNSFVQYTFFQTCLTIPVCALFPPWEPLHLNHLHVSGSTFGELKLIWKFYKNLLYNTVYLFIH